MKTVTISKTMMIIVLLCVLLGAPPALPQPGAQQGAQLKAQEAAQPKAPEATQPKAQETAQQGAQQAAQPESQKAEKPPLRPEELDQLLASIALYPDDLVAQVLSASTYPVEVVQAARFAKEQSKLKGEQLLAAAKDKDWDPSVKAMLEFPDVLKMMDEKLDWTTKVGDAFLSQQRDVMDSIQRLRAKANEAGNLKTTKEQKVIVEEQTQTIVIQPANPQVVYVPTYNPTVVYGTWPYPAYPPYPVYPPGYVATSVFSFAAGVAVGAAWGGLALQLARWRRRYRRKSLQQLHEEQLHQREPISVEPEPHHPILATQSATPKGCPIHEPGDSPEIRPRPGWNPTRQQHLSRVRRRRRCPSRRWSRDPRPFPRRRRRGRRAGGNEDRKSVV